MKSGLLIILMMCVMFMGGCSKMPEGVVQSVDSSFETAISSGGNEYAPEAINVAQNAVSVMKAEIAAQDKKFVLFRTYSESKFLAARAQSVVDSVITVVEANKEAARIKSKNMIGENVSNLNVAKSLLMVAPVGKGSELDIKMIESDIDGIAQLIIDSEFSFGEGRYNESILKSEAIKVSLDKIVQDLNFAIESRK